jgi:hypothetical protein
VANQLGFTEVVGGFTGSTTYTYDLTATAEEYVIVFTKYNDIVVMALYCNVLFNNLLSPPLYDIV